jgi:hypothetical protein
VVADGAAVADVAGDAEGAAGPEGDAVGDATTDVVVAGIADSVGAPETVDDGAVAAAASASIRIETEPADARVTVAGFGSGRAPYVFEAPVGARLQVRVEAAGHAVRREAWTVDGSRTWKVRLEAVAVGRLRLRVLPANTAVVVDGRPVAVAAGGIVEVELPVGAHELVATGPDGTEVRRAFTISADAVTNLRTVEVVAR